MTKAPLFYAIVNILHAPKVVAVTTLKTHQWHGRECRENNGTHGRVSDLHGRFETPEAANAKIAKIKTIAQKHAPLKQAASDAMTDAYRAEKAEIEAALK